MHHKLPQAFTARLQQQAISLLMLSSNTSIIKGAWDSNIQYHPYTGEPIFTYMVINDKKIIGDLKFYGQPVLCRSKKYHEHNIIEKNGICADININVSDIDSICDKLPPTYFAQLLYSIQGGMLQGAMRGTSRILASHLQKTGMPKKSVKRMARFIFYKLFFIMQLHNNYHQYDNFAESYQDAFRLTLINLAYLVMFDTAIGAACKISKLLGNKLEQHGYKRSGKVIKQAAGALRYTIFGYQAMNQGIAHTTAAVVGGSTVELGMVSLMK